MEINIMKTIEGTYTFANIFTTNNEVHAIEDYALAQIQMICDQEASKNCRIRVMPHPISMPTRFKMILSPSVWVKPMGPTLPG